MSAPLRGRRALRQRRFAGVLAAAAVVVRTGIDTTRDSEMLRFAAGASAAVSLTRIGSAWRAASLAPAVAETGASDSPWTGFIAGSWVAAGESTTGISPVSSTSDTPSSSMMATSRDRPTASPSPAVGVTGAGAAALEMIWSTIAARSELSSTSADVSAVFSATGSSRKGRLSSAGSDGWRVAASSAVVAGTSGSATAANSSASTTSGSIVVVVCRAAGVASGAGVHTGPRAARDATGRESPSRACNARGVDAASAARCSTIRSISAAQSWHESMCRSTAPRSFIERVWSTYAPARSVVFLQRRAGSAVRWASWVRAALIPASTCATEAPSLAWAICS